MKKLPWGISVVLHAIVLVLLSLGASGTSDTSEQKTSGGYDGRGNGKNKRTQNKDVIPIELKTEMIPLVSKERDRHGIKTIKKQKECDRWYGGVGITHYSDDRIEKIHPGYPAARSGCVEKGDIIYEVDSKNGQVTGEVGEQITLMLIRDGIRVKCRLTRGKICYRDI